MLSNVSAQGHGCKRSYETCLAINFLEKTSRRENLPVTVVKLFRQMTLPGVNEMKVPWAKTEVSEIQEYCEREKKMVI